MWRQPDHVRLAWIAILANKDFKTHRVRTNALILADQARISRENAEDALHVLCSPDPDSLDPEFEGRRLEKLPSGGYLVLNGEKYSKLMAEFKKKEYDRDYAAERRAEAKKARQGPNPDNSRFEEFWRVYPKREARKRAETAWKSVKPSEVDLILKDVCDKAMTDSWKKDNHKFVPLPASYLNGRRWEDEAKQSNGYDPGQDWKNSL